MHTDIPIPERHFLSDGKPNVIPLDTQRAVFVHWSWATTYSDNRLVFSVQHYCDCAIQLAFVAEVKPSADFLKWITIFFLVDGPCMPIHYCLQRCTSLFFSAAETCPEVFFFTFSPRRGCTGTPSAGFVAPPALISQPSNLATSQTTSFDRTHGSRFLA